MEYTSIPKVESDAHIVAAVREQFPALARQWQGKPLVYLDGPAGTQVPQRVVDAVAEHMLFRNANHGGMFPTSREGDAAVDQVHQAAADLLNASSPEEIIFGANMTSLTFSFSRALSRTWQPGDEIIVTQMDHDANVRPWVLAARDVGVQVKTLPVQTLDCTLDLEAYQQLLTPRTRLVALGCASNSVGTINPVGTMIEMAHAVGAEVFLDAVHFAPHQLIDVQRWNCDYLACSAYKFFGPHIGILWGRASRLQELQPYKLNPAPNDLPGRWMTGTQNFACLAGVAAAIEYLADLGRNIQLQSLHHSTGLSRPIEDTNNLSRRAALQAAFQWIVPYERNLISSLIDKLLDIPGLAIAGITSPQRIDERMPTLALTLEKWSSKALAQFLGERGICAWHGNYYAWELSHALGREPAGMLRLGIVHYNTPDEIEQVVEALQDAA